MTPVDVACSGPASARPAPPRPRVPALPATLPDCRNVSDIRFLCAPGAELNLLIGRIDTI